MTYFINSYSFRGYAHTNTGKPCQDYSLSYKDNHRYIIAVADGHGGPAYIRSDVGARFACQAVCDEFKKLSAKDFKNKNQEVLINKIKLDILDCWNKLVEDHYLSHHFRKKELSHLNNEQVASLNNHYIKAYGTTLTGAIVIGRYCLIVAIGDTEVMGAKKGKSLPVFDKGDEPVANITNSLCQDDAFKHIKVKVCSAKEYDAIILCTDGLSGPYYDYENFGKTFIEPTVKDIRRHKNDYATYGLLKSLATTFGSGDDVSFAIIQRTI